MLLPYAIYLLFIYFTSIFCIYLITSKVTYYVRYVMSPTLLAYSSFNVFNKVCYYDVVP